jgi:glycosyltransferase involved in cell wall biosynthesis
VLPDQLIRPRRVLITLDAVGGIWRYALDLARGLAAHDVTCLLVGFGPEPGAAQRVDCEALTNVEMVWTGEPLDWMVAEADALDPGIEKLAALGRGWDADLLHLNLPSQAVGLASDRPVIVASHSCVPTWWEAMRGTGLPAAWTWQLDRNRAGLRRADVVLAPSESHGAALQRVYGTLSSLRVVYNAAPVVADSDRSKEPMVLGVGRWWDESKNGALLEAAALSTPWPIMLAGPLLRPNGQRAAFHNVKSLGPLTHEDVLRLMRRAAIFAAPSRYEPFGLAVAEAAASGAALVLADIPTFRELWHGAALFVEPDDVDGWGRAFAMLAANEPLRAMLAAQATARAARFNLPRQAARLYEIYTKTAMVVVT